MTGRRGTRIVTFLGLGQRNRSDERPYYYEPVRYELNGKCTVKTELHDVATIEGVEGFVSLQILGTSRVRERWFGEDRYYETKLKEAIGETRFGEIVLEFREIPEGRDETERWRIFEEIVELLSADRLEREVSPPERIVLDITHGFRSQPFFAASAVAFVLSQRRRSGEEDAPPIQILYAAFEAREAQGIAPVWDLTQFLDVVTWDNAIDALIRFGRADDFERLLREEQRRRVNPQANVFPEIQRFGQAAKAFADGLATARIPRILTRLAGKLEGTIPQVRNDLEGTLPPVVQQLDTLQKWVEDLPVERPISKAGIEASLKLAELYYRLERYAEMAATLRETLVSLYTLKILPPEEIRQPAQNDAAFDEQRRRVEERFREFYHDQKENDSFAALIEKVSQLRNDIEHAGFRASPRSSQTIRATLEEVVAEIRKAIEGETYERFVEHEQPRREGDKGSKGTEARNDAKKESPS